MPYSRRQVLEGLVAAARAAQQPEPEPELTAEAGAALLAAFRAALTGNPPAPLEEQQP